MHHADYRLLGLWNSYQQHAGWMQTLTYLNPLRHFLEVLRGAYLKGVGVDVLWPQMVAMGLLGSLMSATSVARFQKSLD